jgi:hypothetical protein
MKNLNNNNMRKIESPSHNILKNYTLLNTLGVKLTHNPFVCVFVALFFSFLWVWIAFFCTFESNFKLQDVTKRIFQIEKVHDIIWQLLNFDMPCLDYMYIDLQNSNAQMKLHFKGLIDALTFQKWVDTRNGINNMFYSTI